MAKRNTCVLQLSRGYEFIKEQWNTIEILHYKCQNNSHNTTAGIPNDIRLNSEKQDHLKIDLCLLEWNTDGYDDSEEETKNCEKGKHVLIYVRMYKPR